MKLLGRIFIFFRLLRLREIPASRPAAPCWLGLVIFVTAIACPASAQTPPEEPLIATAVPEGPPVLPPDAPLDQLVEWALAHNPGLQSARARWRSARYTADAAGYLPDPMFQWKPEIRSEPRRQMYALTQSFPWFGTLDLETRVARADSTVQRHMLDSARLSLIRDVKKAWYEFYYLARSIEITREDLDLTSQLEAVARSRYQAASVPYSDVVKAQVRLGELENSLRSLEDMVEPLNARLVALLNAPADTALVLPASIAEPPALPAADELLASLRRRNPGLSAASSMIAREKASADLAGRMYYPDFMLGLEVETQRMPAPGVENDSMVSAMIALSIPLWRDRYRSAESAAREMYVADIRDRRDRENSLVADASMMLFSVRDAQRRVGLYRDTLIPKAVESLNVSRQAFAAGAAEFLDVIEAQKTLLEFHLSCERAVADRAAALAELEMIVGADLTVLGAAESPAALMPPENQTQNTMVKP